MLLRTKIPLRNALPARRNANLLMSPATYLTAVRQGLTSGYSSLISRPKGGLTMSKKKYSVRAECPACSCGDVSFLGPENLREKFIGNENEIHILCPHCGTKIKGKVETEDD